MTREMTASARPDGELPPEAQRLLERIEGRQAVYGVVGLGYVGLPLAVAMTDAGYRVIGFDVSEKVVDTLNTGDSHIEDVDRAVVAAMRDRGLFEATSDSRRLSECDIICICVPTPLGKTRDPDVSYVVAASEAVAAGLRPGQLVILESTTYPGTTREVLLPLLEVSGLAVGEDFFLCFSPERVDPGNAIWKVKNTPKVLGGTTPTCSLVGTRAYESVLDQVVEVSSTEAAELSKLLENTFRAVNIALVNEMAQVADRLNVDIWEVIEAAASKPFGFMRFSPGPGIGGHCIPLDPQYLSWKMKTLDYRTRLIEIASEINAEMPRYVASKVGDALNEHSKPIRGSRVLVLGVSYKKDIRDTRESPALDVIKLLSEKGAYVRYHDPFVPTVREDGLVLDSVPLTKDELESADCVIILTDHSALNYDDVVARARLVVDSRNATGGTAAGHVVRLSGPRPFPSPAAGQPIAALASS